MNDEVEIKFPKRDVDAIFTAMRRAEREIGASMGGAMKMAGYQLSRTMGASTKVAPAKRPYEILEKRKGPHKSLLIEVRSSRPKGNYKAIIKGSKREANKSPFVRIGMAGLAKSSWKWASKDARTASAIGWGRGVARGAKEWGSKYGFGASRFRGDDVYYRIENRLPYIEQALQGGPRAANDAMRRAAEGLERTIDNKLKQKMNAS